MNFFQLRLQESTPIATLFVISRGTLLMESISHLIESSLIEMSTNNFLNLSFSSSRFHLGNTKDAEKLYVDCITKYVFI